MSQTLDCGWLMLFPGTRQKLAMRLACPGNLVSIAEGTGFRRRMVFNRMFICDALF
jgi:hypothetical protein